MSDEAHILIVWHSRTGGAEAMARAAAKGAAERARMIHCDHAGPQDVLAASAYLFVCPENLATMSGAMKEFFDRSYYPVLGRIEGRGFATAIAAGSDGEGATRQIDRIAKGWRLKRVTDPMIVNFAAQTPEEILAPKSLAERDRAACFELGAALAEGLALGIF